jgi:hypothetical protein
MLERLMEQAPALHAAFMEPSVKKAIDIKMLLSYSLDKIIVARLNGSKSLTTFSISSCSSKDRSILISIAFLNQGENECMPVLPLALILHPRFKDKKCLDEDDPNAAIELLKANALATANKNY